MTAEELIYDAWTPLSFKRHFGSRSASGAGAGFNAPIWVGPEHKRRMLAYALLRAYQDNAAREFIISAEREVIDDRREYGEASLLVNTVLGALLGEDQSIITEGSDEVTEGGDEPTPEALQSQALQEWLEQWATDERLPLKMIEGERRAIGLGDGVYSLGWSGEKGRPRLRVWDPTFYFPVLDDGNEDDYPSKVHIAWEVADPDLKPGKIKVRRITWELGPILAASEAGRLGAILGREDDLHEGDFYDEAGAIARQYPWNDEPSNRTCYLTDATWEMDRMDRRVDDFSNALATYAEDADGPVNRRDLGIDFVPVVHLPNTVSLLEHFGRSVLSTVLQLLDDLSNADTDLAAAAGTTGSPPIALQGGTVARDSKGRSMVTYRPGEILESGEGKLSVLDTSKSLEALIGYIEFLLKRLSVNSRVAESLLGRVKASEVPSGIALALSFGPTEQLIKEMRLVRSEKYPLLLKFAHRLALAGGMDDVPGEWINSEIVMGSFLPQDMTEAVDLVTKLLAAKAISLETAVTMLVEAGFPIRDAFTEVEKIQSRDFEGAAALLDALGSRELVAEYLGRKLPPDAQITPAPQGPGTGTGEEEEPPVDLPGDDPTRFGPDVQPQA